MLNWTDSPASILPTINRLRLSGISLWIYRYKMFFYIKNYQYFMFNQHCLMKLQWWYRWSCSHNLNKVFNKFFKPTNTYSMASMVQWQRGKEPYNCYIISIKHQHKHIDTVSNTRMCRILETNKINLLIDY